MYNYQVGLLAGCDGTDPGALAEELGSVGGSNVDRLYRSKAGLDQQLDFTLIAKSSRDAANSGRVAARQQQAAGLGEVMLKLKFLLELDY